MSGEGQKYQPHLDGLRAIAILTVVGYHVGLLSGGFIGVDIFFVISGYLIIGQIEAGLRTGTFKFRAFYARRILRIWPSLFVMLAASALVAPFALVAPEQLQEFRREITSALLMFANHHFLVSEGDYFGRAIDTKPLLHTWSLMVEEQFYLVAPMVAAGLYLLARRFHMAPQRVVLWFGAVLIAISIPASIAFSLPERNPAFFLVPFRAWEFVVGGMLHYAAPYLARRPDLTRAWMAPAGLALLLFAAAGFSSDALYPSGRVVVPVLGAALVIAGCAQDNRNLVAGLLSVRVLTLIGLLSYNWYLWHWPLLVFGRAVLPDVHPLARDLVAVAAGAGCALVAYHLVEKPFREARTALLRHPVAVLTSGVALFASVAVIAHIQFQSQHASALAERELLIQGKGRATLQLPSCDASPDRAGCPAPPAPRRYVILIGDSHARAIAPAIRLAAAETNVQLLEFIRPGCLGLSNVEVLDHGVAVGRCQGLWDQVLSALRPIEPSAASVIIVQNWGIYLGGRDILGRGRALQIQAAGDALAQGFSVAPRSSLDGATGLHSSVAPRSSLDGATESHQLGLMQQQLFTSLAELEASKVARITLIGPFPHFSRNPVECMMRAQRFSRDFRRCGEAAAAEEAHFSGIKKTLAAVVADRAGRRWIDPTPAYCNVEHCSPLSAEGRLLYVDRNHVSAAGAEAFYSRFRADLIWTLR